MGSTPTKMKELPEIVNISPIKMAELSKCIQDCESSNEELNNISHIQKNSVTHQEEDPNHLQNQVSHQEVINDKRIKVSEKNVRFNVENNTYRFRFRAGTGGLICHWIN